MSFQDYKNRVLKSGAKQMTAISQAEGTKGLADALSMELKNAGRSEAEYDIAKNLEAKAISLGMESKANEIMHTTNTGYGAELVPGNILMTDFLDLAPKTSALLQFFQNGFHGKNMDKKMDVSVIGELPLHQLMAEQTTGAFSIAQGLGKLPTAKVTIEQKERFFTVDISEYESRFAIVDLLAIIKQKLAQSAANTMISDFINGDTVLTANTNINLIDGTPAGTESYTGADGLRKTAFSGSTAVDLGTLAFDDYITLQGYLNNLAVSEDIAFIHSTKAKNAALAISEFKQAYVNGVNSSVMTGALPNFLGSNVYVDRWVPSANTAGKVSATPANNTKGSILCVHKNAVQHGTNGEYQIEVYKIPGKGLQVIGYYFYGHAIASALAGGDPTVALGYNVS